jgi:ABC-2 type transport system ATP-binding protein
VSDGASTTPPPRILLRGLRKRFGARVALAGVDLVVRESQILVVTGPDGAGKTTLLRALAGLLEIEADEARVLGFDLRADVIDLKARLGYVPQSFGLQRDLTVADNMRFTARLHRLPEAQAGPRMDELLQRTGLARFADRLAGKLSGGMKQKLAIANALLPAPELVVLDEPTAGVDVVARGEIWSVLVDAARTALVVVSTSYVDEAERADRLVYLDDGRVVADGTPEELRRRNPARLYRVWGRDTRAIARAARTLAFATSVRPLARFVRIEVDAANAPDAAAVHAAFARLPGAVVVEHAPTDMESTLRHLARAA